MNPYPVNQVFLGSNSLLSDSNIDAQLQVLKSYEEKLKNYKTEVADNSIWNKIDLEISSLTDDQKQRLFNKQDYINLNSQLQNKVQIELLNLVKSKIESDQEGNKLLLELYEVVKTQKKQIIEESNRELELFNKFREYSKNNPEITYEQFIKMNM